MSDFYLIAEVDQPAGNNGVVKIIPVSDFPDRFLKLKKVYLDFWGDKKKFIIEEVSSRKNSCLLKFKNFNSRRDSQVLAGRKVFVDDKNLIKLPENYFFIHDLIDTVVFMKKKKLGVIKDVLKLPANDVLVIEKKDGSEEMIPFVLDFIEKFDPGNRKMTLKIDENFLKDIDEN